MVDLLRRRFPSSEGEVGIGDDAAVFAAPGPRLIFTTDTMVEGVDFELSYFPAVDLGWKVMAINASDVAAMGARPSKAVATLCVPATTPVGFLEDLAEGLGQGCTATGAELVGGDISSSDRISLGVAMLGSVERPVLRSGARAGDAICVTGCLGGAAGGLHLLSRDDDARGPLVERHRRPAARVAEASALRNFDVSSMLDVSDGLVVDLERLMEASGTGCEVDLGKLPVDPHLADVPALDEVETALFGGEDLELLFTMLPSHCTAAGMMLKARGTALTQIGVVTEGERRIGMRSLSSLKEAGWDHLRSR